MRVALGKQVNNAVVITVTVVLAVVVWSIFQYRRIRDEGALNRHIDSVCLRAGELSAAFLQEEIDLKSFQLTHDGSLLPDNPTGRLAGKIEGLRSLTVNDPDVRSRVDSLVAFFNMGPGGYPRITNILSNVEADERRLLDRRRAINQGRASQLQWTLWALSVAVLVLGVLVFRRMRMDIGRANEERERADEERKRANEERERADEERERANEERERANLERARSEDKYKMLFYKSPLPKWIYDEETLEFLEVNDAAVRLYGYSQEEFSRLTLADIRPEEDVDRLMNDIREVRRNPQSYKEGQWRHKRKNGDVIDVEVTAHPVELDGRRARMVAVVDITERRHHERQLERLYDDMQRLNGDLARRAVDLAASNAELERFAYIASHDLQEPLRMVTSFLQLLQKKYGGQLDERADQYIHYAVDGSERMKALIMDLLEYSRVGTGKEAFDWVDSAEVMNEVGEVFREQIVAARAQVEIGPLPRVWGDKVQLTQLLQNLLSNALKYAGKEPLVVAIRAVEKPESWEFSVADNGIGIDPQFFDKIFIIFQRLHNRNEYSGTGIGLAICKKIVERHGGKIWVESGAAGSTFYFTIHKKP
ncbi:MAG TPA: ATP-binding protein [Puia sp.]|nr:ATP-binding protein [Puia sp.]